MLIRYYGPVGIASGYGHAANETCMAILAAGLELDILSYSATPGANQQNYLHRDYAALASCVGTIRPDPDVVIVHTLPAGCATVLEVASIRKFYPKAQCIAYTTWECVSPPREEIVRSLAAFDRVWVPSRATLAAFNRIRSPAWWPPVSVVPHAYDDSRAVVGDDGPGKVAPFRFYYVGAWTRRKNPEGVIQAFLRAFPGNEDVDLTLVSAGAAADAAMLATVAAIGRYDDRVVLRNERIPDELLREIHRTYDCFVTASRGEAWNLPAFDAMVQGRHIISPQALGSIDFLADTTASLIRSYRVPAGGEARAIHQGIQAIGTDITVRDSWMEPDPYELCEQMSRALRDRQSKLGVSYDPAARYGRRAVGTTIRRLLEGSEK